MKKNLRNPKGSRDWLPDEVAKQEFIRKSLVNVFEKWGYQPIQTPILLNWDMLSLGGNKLSESAFKLIGQQGNILALRADLTTPIARVTAERLKEENLPFRFYYVGKVFRYHARKNTNECELYQIGVELIGSKEGFSDLECLKVLSDGLKKLGLNKYLIVLNHTGLWAELFRCFGETAHELYKALTQKDLILFKNILNKSRLNKNEKEFWEEFIQIRGDKTALNRFKTISKKVKKLQVNKITSYYESIFKLFKENIEIDLSLTNDIEYYTGIYFEVITPYMGRSIGAGGRYDQLISKFGFDVPAIGFSLCLEDLLIVLESQGKSFPSIKSPNLISPNKKNIKQTFDTIEKEHNKNKNAALKL